MTAHNYIWCPDAETPEFRFEALTDEMISINSIAKGLSRECRFAGQIKMFYSVAQHSVILSRAMPRFKILGLLHDASEAYLRDIPRPIKAVLPDYRRLETKVQESIYRSTTGLVPEEIEGLADEIHTLDMRLMMTEALALYDAHPNWIDDFYDAGYTPLEVEICPWDCEKAHNTFLIVAQYLL